MRRQKAETTYYAVPDPETGDMTYWYEDRFVNGGRAFGAWPRSPKAHYGPRLWRNPGEGCEHVTPDHLKGEARNDWIRDWYATIRKSYTDKIHAAIDADPAAAKAQFSVFTDCCFICGRVLTDPASKTWGIGPDCREKVSEEMLQAAAREVGRLHASGAFADMPRPEQVRPPRESKPRPKAEAPDAAVWQLWGEHAIIAQYCAIYGRIETPARRFSVSHPKPLAQHPTSIMVRFVKPGKRTTAFFTMTPDNTRYLVIEVGGQVIYDSRKDVPCDMDRWQETRKRFDHLPSGFL